jgi:LysM repeat protein
MNVYTGLKLVVDLPTMSYTCGPNDTFAIIGLKFNTNSTVIQELNPTASPTNVYAGLVLTVPRPVGDFEILNKSEYEWQALLCTSQYETSTAYPNNFGVTGGNFDGAGISWGAIQFNAKTGPLIGMWQTMINSHPTVTLNAFLANANRTQASNQANHDSWKSLFLRGDFAEILPWADARSDPAKDKHGMIEPWHTYFMNLGITTEAQDLQVSNASWYHQVALQWFNEYGLWSRQGYALCFDIAVQSGSMNPKVDGVTYDLIGEINTWYAGIDKTGKTAIELEKEKLLKIANRRADYIDITWQAGYRQRKTVLAEGYGTVNGMVMDTDAKYNMGMEPMYEENVPAELWEPLTVIAGNTAPTATANSYTMDEDTILTVDVTTGILTNDTDPEGNPLTAQVVETTKNGVLSLNSNGSFTYTPNANFNGSDSFTYIATDGSLSSNTATVTITVNPIADPQPPNTDIYIVKSGDVFSIIAQDYGLTTAELSALNPDINPNLIYVGQNLYVPKPIPVTPPELPQDINPVLGYISNSMSVSAVLIDHNPLNVQMIVEASLTADFSGAIERKESEYVPSGTRTSITLNTFDINTVDTPIYVRVLASNGTVSSPIVTHDFIYRYPPPPNTQIYTVEAGDLLSAIAIKFNTSSQTLLELNPFVEEMNIFTGQKMYVPLPVDPDALEPLPEGQNYFLEGNKMDWVASDYLDFNELNRVETTIDTLINTVEAYKSVTTDLQLVTDRIDTDIEWADSFNRIENNIVELATYLNLSNSISPKTDWKALNPVSYVDMNRIEKNILTLYSFAHGNLSLFKYCGQTIVGDKGVV